ncbi:hypothetical protein BKA65DRAFT_506759 [Rhexocercosporidium sp. MPI-PUGE-AT-0058]|nr:hypothetical protein BKA65DRAFT_506759 [Rhexocercosporidium sp. MPI-PUGE-AT-0058]
MWIVQEIVMARQIRLHCGTTSTPWSPFDAFCEFLNKRILATRKPVPKYLKTKLRATMPFQIARQRTKQREGRCSLNSMMIVCRRSKCQDPRDKIFSLLGFVKRSSLDGWPDYERGLLDVYEDVLLDRCKTVFERYKKVSAVNISRELVTYILHGFRENPFEAAVHHALSNGYKPRQLFRELNISSSTITYLGPTPDQVLRNPDMNLQILDTWLSSIDNEIFN